MLSGFNATTSSKNTSKRGNISNIYFLRGGLCVCSISNGKRDFYVMKNYALSALALAAGLATALPATAQQTAVRQGGETAMEMASRINACGGAGFSSASFAEDGRLLRVNCMGGAGLQGGLGTAAAVGGAAAIIAVVAIASDDDDSSSSTTTTN